MTKAILIVEDDRVYRKALKYALSNELYQFFEASSPSKGIEILTAHPHIRVILLDLSFKGTSGTVLLDHIKPSADQYRVIVLTGHDDLLAADQARAYSVFNYQTKVEARFQALRFSLAQAFNDLHRAELVVRNAELSVLVSAVAHEINNTSGVIQPNVDGIRAELGVCSSGIEHKLAVIEDVAKQATEFANEIGGYSLARRGERQAVDINRVLGSMKDRFSSDQNTRLHLELSKRPLVCEIYETPFRQIVRNIVVNALYAIDKRKHGTVRISTSSVGDRFHRWAVITFADNGVGIRPEHIAQIFRPDFTTKPEGNGIGLWLVQSHLAQVGGKIDVDSELDVGTTFRVSIPMLADIAE
jgi:signal transduction histidine kinase